ncbi:inactive phospholipase D5 [Engraulis encrasicolus]|uniref:inactive phospholipase D5 n=1 Tax=Engraulis encrasicolus TaxID=184585 RepID=UPI002FD49C54
MEEEREGLLELKDMARRQGEQIHLLSQWVELLQRPQAGSPGSPRVCWRCRQPGHLARNCDGQRVPAPPQPSPAAQPGRNGRPSPRRPTGGPPSPGLSSGRASGALPGPRDMSMPSVRDSPCAPGGAYLPDLMVENLPEELDLQPVAQGALPLAEGLHSLLDMARGSVEIVSPYWTLSSIEQQADHYSPNEGQRVFDRLLGLKSRGVKLKVTNTLLDSAELTTLAAHNAQIHYVNMTAFTKGHLHSSFWVVDRKHIYIGSAGMDWRSLAKMKELGVLLYNCSCLALDLHRIFSFYWQLHDKDYIPSIWSKRVTALYSQGEPREVELNGTHASAYMSTSPGLFCAKDRTRDVEAIQAVIQEAQTFIYISVTDYLPLVNRSSQDQHVTRYWSVIDEALREALVLRQVTVRLLVSLWERTHPYTFNFLTSLSSLCMQLMDCNLEVKFFSTDEALRSRRNSKALNHNKYMVTDNALYIGNLDWVGNEFTFNAGTGLVIQPSAEHPDDRPAILDQMKSAFERDWFSWYARSLQDVMARTGSTLKNPAFSLVKRGTSGRDRGAK